MTSDTTGGPIDDLHDDLTPDDIRNVVARWATAEPLVRRVYLVGSRARGDHQPDSDTDLVILFDQDPAIAGDGESGDAVKQATWAEYSPRWQTTIAGRIPVAVHIAPLMRSDETIRAKLKGCRVILYRRTRKSAPNETQAPSQT